MAAYAEQGAAGGRLGPGCHKSHLLPLFSSSPEPFQLSLASDSSLSAIPDTAIPLQALLLRYEHIPVLQ